MEAPTPDFLHREMDRHLGLPRGLRTSWGQSFKVCIHSLAFSFLYHSPSQRRRSRQKVPHADGLTLSYVLSHLDEAEQDDEGQGQQFGSRKGILHTGSSLHTVAVHSRE